ncbi:hypothetical protein ABZ252_00455 [Streptomyces sp. NPDC006175]|uniref:hypothetical protein n=1 Tax=Streptomyces sp. NPDC006175 TaxID=3154471 RepID=UPI0033B0DF65
MQSQSASLDHLVQRGRALADCTQADVDAWYAGGCTGTAAIRQLALQAPAPVIARMLGHNDDHTHHRIAEEAGGTRRHYAPGDHRR